MFESAHLRFFMLGLFLKRRVRYLCRALDVHRIQKHIAISKLLQLWQWRSERASGKAVKWCFSAQSNRFSSVSRSKLRNRDDRRKEKCQAGLCRMIEKEKKRKENGAFHLRFAVPDRLVQAEEGWLKVSDGREEGFYHPWLLRRSPKWERVCMLMSKLWW